MKTAIFVVALLCGTLFISSCSTNPNEAANKLYVEASLLLDKARQENSDRGVLTLYEETKRTVDLILSEYPSADVAVDLLAGKTTLSGLTLSEFRAMQHPLEALAFAEDHAVEYARMVADKIDEEPYKAIALAVLSSSYQSVDDELAAKLLDEALELMLSIDDPKERANALFLAASQNDSDALETLTLAREAVAAIPDDADRARSMASLAKQYIALEQQEEASQLLVQAGELVLNGGTFDTDWALTEIIGGYIELGDLDEARAVADYIADDWQKETTLASIVGGYARNGSFEEALRLLDTIVTPSYKGTGSSAIAGEYVKTGEIDKAVAFASEIQDPSIRVEALIAIMKACSEAEDWSCAQSAINDGLEAIENLDDLDDEISATVAIAAQFAELGQGSDAETLLVRANGTLQLVSEGLSADLTRRDIAIVYAQMADVATATEFVESINEDWIEEGARAAIVDKFAEYGNYVEALNIIKDVEDRYSKAIMMALLMDRYADSGMVPSEKERAIMRDIALTESGAAQFWQ